MTDTPRSTQDAARCAKWIFAAILSAMAAPSTAAAQTADKSKGEATLAAILPPSVGKIACFSRTYDAPHLQQHPHQQVTAMTFELRYVQAPTIDAKRYIFGMSAKLRTRPDTLYTSGWCETNINGAFPGGNLCVVACDGGGVSIQKMPHAEALYVHLQTPALGIRMGTACDAQNERSTTGIMLEPGADDKIFRLEAAPAARCRALERAEKLDRAR